MGLPDRQRMTESAGPVTTATAPDSRARKGRTATLGMGLIARRGTASTGFDSGGRPPHLTRRVPCMLLW